MLKQCLSDLFGKLYQFEKESKNRERYLQTAHDWSEFVAEKLPVHAIETLARSFGLLSDKLRTNLDPAELPTEPRSDLAENLCMFPAMTGSKEQNTFQKR